MEDLSKKIVDDTSFQIHPLLSVKSAYFVPVCSAETLPIKRISKNFMEYTDTTFFYVNLSRLAFSTSNSPPAWSLNDAIAA